MELARQPSAESQEVATAPIPKTTRAEEVEETSTSAPRRSRRRPVESKGRPSRERRCSRSWSCVRQSSWAFRFVSSRRRASRVARGRASLRKVSSLAKVSAPLGLASRQRGWAILLQASGALHRSRRAHSGGSSGGGGSSGSSGADIEKISYSINPRQLLGLLVQLDA